MVGDFVTLGPGAPVGYRGKWAVVSKVEDKHSTVVVLDDDRRWGVGECWPAHEDMTVEDVKLRSGSRVIVESMQGSRTKRLNGLSGAIVAHPKQGHPCFINSPASTDLAKLVVCVKFDDPTAAGEKTAMLEPRFLRPYGEMVRKLSAELLTSVPVGD